MKQVTIVMLSVAIATLSSAIVYLLYLLSTQTTVNAPTPTPPTPEPRDTEPRAASIRVLHQREVA